jgi:hypothetical protein
MTIYNKAEGQRMKEEMTTYKATLTYEAPNADAATQKLTTALYLGDIDVEELAIGEVNADGTVFNYPHTRRLIEHLSGSVELDGVGNAAE